MNPDTKLRESVVIDLLERQQQGEVTTKAHVEEVEHGCTVKRGGLHL